MYVSPYQSQVVTRVHKLHQAKTRSIDCRHPVRRVECPRMKQRIQVNSENKE